MKHHSNPRIILVTENRRTGKEYRIKNGDVQVKFKGKWYSVEETKIEYVNLLRKSYTEYGTNGYCKVINW